MCRRKWESRKLAALKHAPLLSIFYSTSLARLEADQNQLLAAHCAAGAVLRFGGGGRSLPVDRVMSDGRTSTTQCAASRLKIRFCVAGGVAQASGEEGRMFERSEFAALPMLAPQRREPRRGDAVAVAFLCLLIFGRDQRK